MVLFLDIEHPRALEDQVYRDERAKTMEMRRSLFERLAGETCITRHYSEFKEDELADPSTSALVTSGNRSLWEDYDIPTDFRRFKEAIEETTKPVLGICGGHQLIGLLLGGEARPLRRLTPEEVDIYPEYSPGWLKEWGYSSIQVDVSDPLFNGFSNSIIVEQRHFWELSRLPEKFRAIAHNRNCAIQAMRHKEKPLYGVQFHPEFHDASHEDGRLLLMNFFSLPKS